MTALAKWTWQAASCTAGNPLICNVVTMESHLRLRHPSAMKSALFPKWRTNPKVEEARLESGDMTVHVVPGIDQLTFAVAGRITVDSSPDLRCALLERFRPDHRHVGYPVLEPTDIDTRAA